ncbi:reverse transcriptase domain-containing protein [Tanacetum coccineum]
MEKIFQIFQDLRFDISFVDALLLMPRFSPTIKSLLMNKEKLLELAKIPLNENCSAMLLKKLPKKLKDPGKFLIPCNFPGMDVFHALADLGVSINLMPLSFWKKLSLPELTLTRMTLELADRSFTHPKGLAEEVFAKVRKFHFLTDFVVVDFEADPSEYLFILEILFKKPEFSQEVLGFSNNSLGGNPTSFSDPILSSTTPSFTLFEGGDFTLEEIDTFLQTSDEFTDLDDDFYDTKGDILYLEQLLNEDPSPTLPPEENEDLNPWVSPVHCVPKKGGITVVANEENKLIPTHFGLCNAPGTFQRCMMAIFLDMIEKTIEVIMDDFSVFGDSFDSCLSNLEKMLKRCEDTNLVLNWEKCYFMCIEGIVLGHKISKSEIEVDRANVDVIAKLPHPNYRLKGVRNGTPSSEKETFVFSKDCIDAFETLKKKLTEASILVVPDWNLPFELMCDASDFPIGAVLGQRKTKHFQPIHYASKTMDRCSKFITHDGESKELL